MGTVVLPLYEEQKKHLLPQFLKGVESSLPTALKLLAEQKMEKQKQEQNAREAAQDKRKLDAFLTSQGIEGELLQAFHSQPEQLQKGILKGLYDKSADAPLTFLENMVEPSQQQRSIEEARKGLHPALSPFTKLAQLLTGIPVEEALTQGNPATGAVGRFLQGLVSPREVPEDDIAIAKEKLNKDGVDALSFYEFGLLRQKDADNLSSEEKKKFRDRLRQDAPKYTEAANMLAKAKTFPFLNRSLSEATSKLTGLPDLSPPIADFASLPLETAIAGPLAQLGKGKDRLALSALLGTGAIADRGLYRAVTKTKPTSGDAVEVGAGFGIPFAGPLLKVASKPFRTLISKAKDSSKELLKALQRAEKKGVDIEKAVAGNGQEVEKFREFTKDYVRENDKLPQAYPGHVKGQVKTSRQGKEVVTDTIPEAPFHKRLATYDRNPQEAEKHLERAKRLSNARYKETPAKKEVQQSANKALSTLNESYANLSNDIEDLYVMLAKETDTSNKALLAKRIQTNESTLAKLSDEIGKKKYEQHTGHFYKTDQSLEPQVQRSLSKMRHNIIEGNLKGLSQPPPKVYRRFAKKARQSPEVVLPEEAVKNDTFTRINKKYEQDFKEALDTRKKSLKDLATKSPPIHNLIKKEIYFLDKRLRGLEDKILGRRYEMAERKAATAAGIRKKLRNAGLTNKEATKLMNLDLSEIIDKRPIPKPTKTPAQTISPPDIIEKRQMKKEIKDLDDSWQKELKKHPTYTDELREFEKANKSIINQGKKAARTGEFPSTMSPQEVAKFKKAAANTFKRKNRRTIKESVDLFWDDIKYLATKQGALQHVAIPFGLGFLAELTKDYTGIKIPRQSALLFGFFRAEGALSLAKGGSAYAGTELYAHTFGDEARARRLSNLGGKEYNRELARLRNTRISLERIEDIQRQAQKLKKKKETERLRQKEQTKRKAA